VIKVTAPAKDRGYTLVELVVTMAIFGIVMTLITVSFNRIVSSSGQLIKGVETDIGDLIGLELLRVDLGLAGFGLPWSLGNATYTEATAAHMAGRFPGTLATNYNDSKDNPLVNDGRPHPPRPYAVGNDVGPNGSDYLVLKGTALGNMASTPNSRGWSYLNYSTVGFSIKPSKAEVELVPGSGTSVIIVNTGGRGAELRRDLVTSTPTGATTVFSTRFYDKENFDKNYGPQNREDRYLVYGIDDDAPVTFPFNRVDYYLDTSKSSPITCAPGTYTLKKGTILQKDGSFYSIPILDCVLDMQVIFLLDLNHNGILVPQDLEDYRKAVADQGGDPAEALREHVREVRIFILAQQGKRDDGYRYPVKDPNSVFTLGDKDNGKVWKESDLLSTVGAGWQRYRWKVYTIVDHPKNLQ
jgi:prepilin-type N-terminal cleavage/methylation domain-containing protein